MIQSTRINKNSYLSPLGGIFHFDQWSEGINDPLSLPENEVIILKDEKNLEARLYRYKLISEKEEHNNNFNDKMDKLLE